MFCSWKLSNHWVKVRIDAKTDLKSVLTDSLVLVSLARREKSYQSGHGNLCQHLNCYIVRVLDSLIPRPHPPPPPPKRVAWYPPFMHAQINYEKGSVCVSMNDLSLMARSRMEAVHKYSKWRARNHPDFLQLKRPSTYPPPQSI